MVITVGNLLTSVRRSHSLHSRLKDHVDVDNARIVRSELEFNAVRSISLLQASLKAFSKFDTYSDLKLTKQAILGE